ncbi:hypothetical protein U1Q18_010185 [Sarracenia purpurea var. burkii]
MAKKNGDEVTNNVDRRNERQGLEQKRGQFFNSSKRLNIGTPSATIQTTNAIPVCPMRQKVHWDAYQKAFGASYECGHIEHLKRDGPKLLRNSTMTGPGPSNSIQKSVNKLKAAKKEGHRQGRVFALVPGDTQAADTVV